MMRFLADENFNNDLLRGLKRQIHPLDIVRVQDTEVYQADDPAVLEWAAREGRIVITHDVQTLPGYAFERVVAGLPMPGVIEVAGALAIGQVLDDLVMLISAGSPADFENQVRYVPLH